MFAKCLLETGRNGSLVRDIEGLHLRGHESRHMGAAKPGARLFQLIRSVRNRLAPA